MKNIFIIIFLAISLCSCCVLPNKNGAGVLFSSRPISMQTLLEVKPEKNFQIGQKIFFTAYCEKGFGSGDLRIQILKKNEKVNILGYSIEHARDIEISPDKQYFSNTFHIYNKGCYFFRLFAKEAPTRPLAETYFWIH